MGRGGAAEPEPDLGAGAERVSTEAHVGLKKVGLYTPRRFNGYLATVLQDGYWELVARQAG